MTLNDRLSKAIYDLGRALDGNFYVHESTLHPILKLLRDIADDRDKQRFECHGPDCPGARYLPDKYEAEGNG